VDHVAERGELDERDVHLKRSTMRAMRSRVAWSLGSPTTATRPPTARTVPDSGTAPSV
jgi:hypothetical protein